MIPALVDTAVRFQETQLWRHHRTRLERLRNAAGPLLTGATGPVLLVDEEGWVAHASDVVVPTQRVAAPRPDRLLPVPGLGTCLPEPVAGGWLLRPSGQEPRLAVTLDLSTPPLIEVTGERHQWRRTLPARHAEILDLLHLAGPAGRTAAELSHRIHGDAQHLVTVRAEISRMRRSIGGIVESQPYRISSAVRMTVRRASETV